jgi:hypothetical protein
MLAAIGGLGLLSEMFGISESEGSEQSEDYEEDRLSILDLLAMGSRTAVRKTAQYSLSD